MTELKEETIGIDGLQIVQESRGEWIWRGVTYNGRVIDTGVIFLRKTKKAPSIYRLVKGLPKVINNIPLPRESQDPKNWKKRAGFGWCWWNF